MKFSLHVNFAILPFINFAALKFRGFADFACISCVFFMCTKFSRALNFREFVQFAKLAKVGCTRKFHGLQYLRSFIWDNAHVVFIWTEKVSCWIDLSDICSSQGQSFIRDGVCHSVFFERDQLNFSLMISQF